MSNNVNFVSPADKLAKKMLTDLSCVSCKSLGLRSDGSAKGRLRLVCNGCRKTIYADTHPRIICEMRTKSDGRQLSLSTTPKPLKMYQKSIPSDPMQVYHQHDTPLMYRDTDTLNENTFPALPKSMRTSSVSSSSSSSLYSLSQGQGHNVGVTSESIRPMLPAGVSVRDTQLSHPHPHHQSDTSMYHDKDTSMYEDDFDGSLDSDEERNLGFLEAYADIQQDVETMKKTNMRFQATTKAEMNDIKSTMNLLLLKISELQESLRQPMNAVTLTKANSHLLHHVSDTDTRPSYEVPTIDTSQPWVTAARRGARAPLPRRPPSTVPPTHHSNRFKELSASIPAYAKFDTEEQYVAHVSRTATSHTRTTRLLSREEMDNVKKGRPSKGSSPMVHLYFEGMRRNRPTEIRSFLHSIGIQSRHARNISFIGGSIMSILTFEDVKNVFIEKLAIEGIQHLAHFDPLSGDNLKDPKKFGNLKTNEERTQAARKLFINRTLKTIERLPKTPINNRMRNYYQSILDNLNNSNETPVQNVSISNTPDVTKHDTPHVPISDTFEVSSHDTCGGALDVTLTEPVAKRKRATPDSEQDIDGDITIQLNDDQ